MAFRHHANAIAIAAALLCALPANAQADATVAPQSTVDETILAGCLPVFNGLVPFDDADAVASSVGRAGFKETSAPTGLAGKFSQSGIAFRFYTRPVSEGKLTLALGTEGPLCSIVYEGLSDVAPVAEAAIAHFADQTMFKDQGTQMLGGGAVKMTSFLAPVSETLAISAGITQPGSPDYPGGDFVEIRINLRPNSAP